jgi:DNA polymerase-3 subunit gamma/tau
VTLALARKWRPKTFDEMVGQEHVVRALTNALTQNRLHHAYLLTGTRGVGKTTLARVMAKALNCETGITAAPCGKCTACLEIDGGRFVDLVELDAASNTQVDQMRELLENALYAPTRARFKVYIIDEVHMLSRSAFNAMLKTLEEPPQHVKFVLATTDPQKVPVTVLSRCLQFNLKQIPVPQIVEQLGRVLEREQVGFDAPALQLIARAAQGSMRDALSLLDQAIAHGAGKVEEEPVRAMLGTVDRDYLFGLVDALLAGDGPRLIGLADQMQARSLSFENALQELATLLHRLALIQQVPQAVTDDDPDQARLVDLAQRVPAQDLQLYYQIAVQGRSDLWLAPDEYAGFTMALLRMLAFAPAGEAGAVPRSAGPATAARPASPGRPAAAPAASPSASAPATPAAPPRPAATPGSGRAPYISPSAPAPARAATSGPLQDPPAPAPAIEAQEWPVLVATLKLGGMARMLAQHCELVRSAGNRIELRLPEIHRHLLEKPYRDKLQAALEEHFAQRVALDIALGEATGTSPAALEDRERQARQRLAVEAIDRDPFVRELVEHFDARVIDDSIRPVDPRPGAA